MSTEIGPEELRGLCDFAQAEERVTSALRVAGQSPRATLRFLGRYASWNGWFGSGVAALAAKIGRSRALFIDPNEPVLALADRSVLVASYFFDAARDEFDDRDTVHRDTHRCLAQALLKGSLGFLAAKDRTLSEANHVNELLAPPLWLDALGVRVAESYGAGTIDDPAGVFRAIGYHLGSEVLADREFSLIDESMRRDHSELVAQLTSQTVEIAGQEHVAYQWIAIHSGHGGGAEADHFEWATRGARLALGYVPEKHRAPLRRQIHIGFIDFARDHREFFENVSHA
jgi:hypothetical protein